MNRMDEVRGGEMTKRLGSGAMTENHPVNRVHPVFRLGRTHAMELIF